MKRSGGWRWRLDQRWTAVAVAVVLGFVAITIVLARSDHGSSPSCPRRAELVPSCGVILGITPPRPTVQSLASVERALGHPFALVYSFHDLNDPVPSSYDRAVVAAGSLLHITIDATVYGRTNRDVSWSQIAAGTYDADLTRDARGIAALHQPVFVTFDHEPDQPAKAGQGTPAEYVAAWRHVHDLFARVGASNAVWVWVVTGWSGSSGTALRMWPGNAYVDWISWEAYDNRGCIGGGAKTTPISFAQAALPFYRWLRAHGPSAGIDLHKPMMISEAGSSLSPGSPPNAGWFAGMQRVLREHPQIKAVTWWDHAGSSPDCDYTFTEDPQLLRRARSVAALPWFGH